MYRKLLISTVCFFLFLSFGVTQHLHHNHSDEESIENLIFTQVEKAKCEQPSFPNVALFAESKLIQNPIPHVKEWMVCNIGKVELNQIFQQKLSALTLQLPSYKTQALELDLIQCEVLAEGFQVFTSEKDNPSYTAGLFYRGIVKGEQNSIVAISVFQDEIYGMISINNQNYIIQPSTVAKGEFILYNDKNVERDAPMECMTTERMAIGDPHLDKDKLSSRAAGDCVKTYVECDYALYLNKGNVTNTVNYITAVYNNVATLYANESINTTISEVYVWTTADSYSKTSSITALNQFRTARPTFNGNLAHLAALGGQNIGGVAWLDVLCTNYNYAYSNISSTYANVPTYSWTIEVMTHEMGHNLGSNHTQWCGWTGGALDNCYTTEGGCAPGPAPTSGGTIMSYCHLTSYGINFNNGFGAQPGNKIRNRVAAVTCLPKSCGSSCPTPTGLNASNIQNTSAVISWAAASGAVTYKLDYKLNASSTWTTISTSNTTYTLTGLTLGTAYNARVQTVCSSGSSTYSNQITFTTTGGSCLTPTGLAISNISSTSALASWSASGSASSYNFQYKLSTTSTWTQVNSTSTSVQLTGLSPNSTYNTRVQSVCGSSTSVFSAQVNFNTPNTTSYCASKGVSSSQEWIKRVKLTNVDRNSGSDGGYFDATALIANITKGVTTPINFQAGITGSSRYLYWTIWIDYNKNGSFNDAGERVVIGVSNSTNLLYTSFKVPTTAITGITRMRIAMKQSAYASSCETFARGEVEDYSVNIINSGTLLENKTQGQSKPQIENVSLFPNPTRGNIQLNFDAASDHNSELKIQNTLGVIVKELNLAAYAGNNFYDVNLSNLPNGNYILSLKSKDQIVHKKFVVSE